MSKRAMAVWPGRPYPLGATWDGLGVNFALFSQNAERVDLCLFDSKGEKTVERVAMRWQTDQVWHCYLPKAAPGLLYGYRVFGPHKPELGHRFNPYKLLIDPYARALHGRLTWSEAHFGYTIGHPLEDLSFDGRNNAADVPKSRVVDSRFDWEGDRHLDIPWNDTVIYELHVKGFTLQNPDVAPPLRGTYAGLASEPAIEHLRRLGITAVQLLPIHAFIDEEPLVRKGLSNYWGYNTIGFFAPEMRYSASGEISEFKSMVKRLHAARIEVILDVVYNHTAEGNHFGPTLCFRGIDNLSYYRLAPENPRFYNDYTGCGNTLNAMHPRVLQLIMDSLRYWVQDMHVDGFRFDLAPALARARHEVDRLGAFLDIVHQDPIISHMKLIAEPWDLGEGGYQIGNFPVGWTELNGKYRDAVRSFWRGDPGYVGEMGYRLTGSSDLYQTGGRKPYSSINFVASHDGFTLHDLVSYNEKHNQANLEDNLDGWDDNRSWNCGASDADDGPHGDFAVRALRARQKRNFIFTLFLSQGVPFLQAGDEMGRTQQGNNNAYCQDNEISWVNWRLKPEDRELLAFTRRLIELRKSHPIFRRRSFFSGKRIRGTYLKDAIWLNAGGREMNQEDWSNPETSALGLFLTEAGLEQDDERGRPMRDQDFLLLLNAGERDISFKLPAYGPVEGWRAIIDTGYQDGFIEASDYGAGALYPLRAHSAALLTQATEEPRREAKSAYREHRMPFGTELPEEDKARFRLWAPAAQRVEIVLKSRSTEEVMSAQAQGDGWFEATCERPYEDGTYAFKIDGRQLVPDPASRFQPETVHGPSQLIDPASYKWRDTYWKGRPWEEAVLYEIHVGCFSPEGTFAGVRKRLDHLVELGVTALELMPVAAFGGTRNWGYDGVLPFAPSGNYGTPDDLKDLVETAHAKGLMVFLDVVYNHFGPEGNYLHSYAPRFFSRRYSTPWGGAIDFEGPESRVVRDFFIHNALYWLEEYHLDGLRLDAVHAIFDRSSPDILVELAETVRRGPGSSRHIHLVLENDNNASRYLSRGSDRKPKWYTAQWNEDLHHVLHVLCTAESDGYYRDYVDAPVTHLGRCLAEGFCYQGERSIYRQNAPRGEPTAGLPPTAFVSFVQNHDQVGNRALGERLTEIAAEPAVRAVTALALLAPGPPLLFMGQEWGSRKRFNFFCDFSPELGAAVAEARRSEFARFSSFGDRRVAARIPDPNDADTFYDSRLDWESLDGEAHQRWLAFHRELLEIRHQEITPRLRDIPAGAARYRLLGKRAIMVEWKLGDGSGLTLAANLAPRDIAVKSRPAGRLIYSTDSQVFEGSGKAVLPGWTVAWFLDDK